MFRGYLRVVDYYSNGFYVRQQNASLVRIWPAGAFLFVCPSVTLLYCIKTVQAKITKSSLWLPRKP